MRAFCPELFSCHCREAFVGDIRLGRGDKKGTISYDGNDCVIYIYPSKYKLISSMCLNIY